ncbi:hypothetical protein EBME_1218 [bacterium endosymbiont of Mortierella elongata FMR23-6]|nr:hypothetical protein EBME_1218 [bacterium endosymbiont of Mortierella elongata FMR23-6]
MPAGPSEENWDGKGKFNDTRHLVAVWQELLEHSDKEETQRKKELLLLRARGVINEFAIRGDRSSNIVREVVALAELSDADIFRALLGHFINAIDKETLLQVQLLDGLAQILQQAKPGTLNADDGVQILGVLDAWRKKLFHKEKDEEKDKNSVAKSLKKILPACWRKDYLKSAEKAAEKAIPVLELEEADHIDNLLRALAALLDAMADANVKGLNREQLHTPLYQYLNDLSKDSNIRRAYQATYACQALLHVPDDEKLWQSVWRRSMAITGGALALAKAVHTCNPGDVVNACEQFSIAFSGLGQLIKTTQEVVETVKTLSEAGKSAAEGFREGFDFRFKKPWYTALRHTAFLIQTQKFQSLNAFVQQASVGTRQNPNFLFGLSLQLEQVACTVPDEGAKQDEKDLYEDARKGAFAWLEDIYLNDERWGSSERVKQGVLSSIARLAGDTQPRVSEAARTCWVHLAQDKDPTKKSIYEAYMLSSLGEPALPRSEVVEKDFPKDLLNAVQDKPIEDLEKSINEQFNKLNAELVDLAKKLTRTGLGGLDAKESLELWRNKQLEDKELKQMLSYYVPPEGKYKQQDIHPFGDLRKEVENFLQPNSNKKVLLLLGDSGAGKSTFNRYLARGFWEKHKEASEANLPLMALFISLPLIKDPVYNLVHEYLSRQGFSRDQIKALKENEQQNFVFILDGYDEISQRQNLYVMNKFLEEWPRAKVIISCRTESLGQDYQATFQPRGQDEKPDPEGFQELVVAPFSKDQIDQYIERYVEVDHPFGWSIERYGETIKSIPKFNELVNNPFILRLALEIMPLWEKEDVNRLKQGAGITRLDLYDLFIQEWFARAKARLEDRRHLTESEQLIFQELGENFEGYGIEFSQCLAVELYENPLHQGVMDHTTFESKRAWETFFKTKGFRHKEVRLLLEYCPLRRSGQQYRFLHQSILEYFVARAVFGPQSAANRQGATLIPQVQSSYDSLDVFLNFESQTDAIKACSTLPIIPLPDSSLTRKRLIEDHSIIRFLVERVEKEPKFEEQLQAFIERSKTEENYWKAAANAMTVLVKAGVQFKEENLNGIKVPGADLSYGIFDNAQLQGADLRKVNLRGTWLRGANFERAKLNGVNFGELPSLEVGKWVTDCCYSGDGRWLAIGTRDEVDKQGGEIRLYKTDTLEPGPLFKANCEWVNSVKFSPNSQFLASGSNDTTVKRWNVERKQMEYERGELGDRGHKGIVSSVSFSLKNETLASGSWDGKIKLWSVSGECLSTLDGHTDAVKSVSFSPDGNLLASGSDDQTVRLWDTERGQELTLCRQLHGGKVSSVTFSSKGNLLASGSEDMTVRLWSVEESGEELPTRQLHSIHELEGHTSAVMSVSFSPDGNLLASGSNDRTVRLWSVKSGETLYTFEGHGSLVDSVAFSLPDGQFLASGSADRTVRLWRVESRQESPALGGHHGQVDNVAFSPNGNFLASGSYDKTIKLWNVENGKMLDTLKGHKGHVNCVTFSSDSEILASGGDDNTVRLWSVKGLSPTQGLPPTQSVGFYGHTKPVWCVSFSPTDNNLLASGGNDNTVRLWRVQDKTQLYEFSHDKWVSSVSFSADGNLLASGSEDGMVKLWELEDRKTLQLQNTPVKKEPKTTLKHGKWVTSVSFSPTDKNLLASGDNNNTVKLWNIESPEMLYTLEGHIKKGHTKAIKSITFSPDGKLLALGNRNGAVKIWSINTDQREEMPELTPAGCFSDCGGKIASIAWQELSEARIKMKMAGSKGSTVHILQIEREKDNDWTVRLDWISSQNKLIVSDMSIKGAQNLSPMNARLLKQKGALGEPAAPV